ncbi:E3 ubiquitin-protein ligase TRIM7-like isoform X2 [Falco peregrinus]|uniref:E3 ubiquitin-protein ligase TRIM7-like isoform X2 n=1 Tax=Falco peregrinus TaxID=8954 RepID=UPI00247AA207|nr:E3 ubiquitin-protein ligase TRIM7-like isoform X2 [Falco peregrinus]
MFPGPGATDEHLSSSTWDAPTPCPWPLFKLSPGGQSFCKLPWRRTYAQPWTLLIHPLVILYCSALGSALVLPALGVAGRETPFPCSEENESGCCLTAHIFGGPMAVPSPTTGLPSEAFCSICLEYFRDPVSIHCGHNFCRACITRCWEWSTANFSCPQCHETAPERNLRPSRELARVLEIAKRLSSQAARGETVEVEGCERHQEPLKVFCKDDEAFICVVCRESRLHRSHTMLPVQDAVQEYKGQIQARLQALKEDRDKLLGFRDVEMKRNWEYLEKTKAERQRVFSTFEGLRLFLEDHARDLLAQLGVLERDIEKMQEENITSLTKEISCLDTLIQEMEEKCQQPASKFLQDIRSTLNRFQNENFQQLPLLLSEHEKKISHFREKNIAVEEILKSFQDVLMFELPEKMKVTLDPSTAHPQLVVSEDRRSVRWEDAQQDPSAEGFGTDPYVLGCEGITSGRFCWDVEVSPPGSWAVGVARESLKRKEETAVSSEMELWSMGLCEGQFWALTSLERIPLYQIQVPRRVRVSLDYEKGQVAFFDADKRALIFTFPAVSFKGESIHPWFLVWSEGSQITLCP